MPLGLRPPAERRGRGPDRPRPSRLLAMEIEETETPTLWARQMHSPDARLREEAARRLWLHFAERLRGVGRRHLDPMLLRRAGEDDVLQSLFASFFTAPPGSGGPPANRVELWRLL